MADVGSQVRSEQQKSPPHAGERRKRAARIAAALRKLFPEPKIALRYGTPWELYVAVVLSAQCTDKKVNEITSALFRKYRTLKDYRRANFEEFAADIRQSGFYRAKAKYILEAARLVTERHGGELPCSMAELLALPGVARKTGNVILGEACGICEGIAIDTHVRRFARKFDLSDSRDPLKIELDFMALFPREAWPLLTHRFIEYGRQICPARVHDCIEHPLTKLYPKAATVWPRAK